MRPRARILGIAAAWALLGSGCDFWRNLTEPHKADHVDLVLTVKDAWTGEALPWADCSVEGAGALTADAEGRIYYPRLATGAKTVACSTGSYHARNKVLDAAPGRDTFEIDLARMGGEHWYPGRPELQVRIHQNAGNLRFPGKLWLQGYPYDSSPIFRYAWNSTRHGTFPPLNPLPVETGNLDQDSVTFTVTLVVTATLAERTYEVGRYEQPFVLARNRQPIFREQAFNLAAPVRVGTGCEVKYLSLGFDAEDPDGDSCTVRLVSQGQNSPLGEIDSLMACGTGILVELPLRHHDGPVDNPLRPLTRTGSLRVEVHDENEGSVSQSFPVTTYSNLPPVIRLDQVGVKERHLAGELLTFRITTWDGDTKLDTVRVDWMDGTQRVWPWSFLQFRDTLDAELTHVYDRAGTYTVEAKAWDKCGIMVKTRLPITILDSSQFPIRGP